MKQVQFRANGSVIYEVSAETEDYYILNHHPVGWSHVCLVAVPKSEMTVVEEVTYKTGQRFHVGSNPVILAQTGFLLCALIGLKDGNRYADSIVVENASRITKKELRKMSYTLAVLVT